MIAWNAFNTWNHLTVHNWIYKYLQIIIIITII